MRKAAALLLTVILFSVLILNTACEPVEDGGNARRVSPAEITGAVVSEGTFPEMVERTLDDMREYYFGIDLEGVVDASYRISPAGAFSDEVTVVMVESNREALDRLKSFFEDWISSRADMWRSYNPEQARKFDNAVVNINGDYIAMFICEDPQAAVDSFNGFLL